MLLVVTAYRLTILSYRAEGVALAANGLTRILIAGRHTIIRVALGDPGLGTPANNIGHGVGVNLGNTLRVAFTPVEGQRGALGVFIRLAEIEAFPALVVGAIGGVLRPRLGRTPGRGDPLAGEEGTRATDVTPGLGRAVTPLDGVLSVAVSRPGPDSLTC
jgi:hypothetical protein